MGRIRFKKLRLWLMYPVFIIYPFVARMTTASWAFGTLLIVLGLAVRFWASGYITKSHRLTTAGPYAYMRNPLYVGNLLLGIGIVVMANQPWLLAYYLAVFVIFYVGTVREEQNVLAAKFGEAYQDYLKQVPAFFPTGRYYQKAERKPFDVNQSFKNGEFIRLCGFLLLPPFFYLFQVLWVEKRGFGAAQAWALIVFLVFFGLLWFNIFIRRQWESIHLYRRKGL